MNNEGTPLDVARNGEKMDKQTHIGDNEASVELLQALYNWQLHVPGRCSRCTEAKGCQVTCKSNDCARIRALSLLRELTPTHETLAVQTFGDLQAFEENKDALVAQGFRPLSPVMLMRDVGEIRVVLGKPKAIPNRTA